MDNRLSSLFDLSGKIALVTGASGGIGQHFSNTLSAAGAHVILTARRTARLESAVNMIQASDGSASCIKLDVTDQTDVQAAFADAIKQFGRIDIVVNNAGIASSGNALDIDPKHWDDVMATNLKGAWLVAQQAGRSMSVDGKGGSLINIASILGLRVMGGVAPYASAKAGLDHLTRLLAYEWARFDVRVNAIAPGYVETDINREFLNSPAGEKARNRIPQKRFGRPKDLDGAMLLLASDASSYMTGSTIVVDGGHLQSSM